MRQVPQRLQPVQHHYHESYLLRLLLYFDYDITDAESVTVHVAARNYIFTILRCTRSYPTCDTR